MIVVVYGTGAGKTRHAAALCNLWKLRRVVDGWDGRTPLEDGDLGITNTAPPFSGAPTATEIPVRHALAEIRHAMRAVAQRATGVITGRMSAGAKSNRPKADPAPPKTRRSKNREAKLDEQSRPLRNALYEWARVNDQGCSGCWQAIPKRWEYTVGASWHVYVDENGGTAQLCNRKGEQLGTASTPRGLAVVLSRYVPKRTGR